MNDLKDFRASLRNRNHAFSDTLAFIASAYDYQPSRFVKRHPGKCRRRERRLLQDARHGLLEGFSTEEALLAFGEHYQAVLANPNGSDHRNIRALMETGLPGVRFDSQPLKRK
jgi:HopJ type III effector protein.